MPVHAMNVSRSAVTTNHSAAAITPRAASHFLTTATLLSNTTMLPSTSVRAPKQMTSRKARAMLKQRKQTTPSQRVMTPSKLAPERTHHVSEHKIRHEHKHRHVHKNEHRHSSKPAASNDTQANDTSLLTGTSLEKSGLTSIAANNETRTRTLASTSRPKHRKGRAGKGNRNDSLDEDFSLQSKPTAKSPAGRGPKNDTSAVVMPPKAPSRVKRVANGDSLSPSSPLHKSLAYIKSSQYSTCSGALVAPNKVLTAAHCLILKKDKEECTPTSKFASASAEINGARYHCKSYSMPTECVQMERKGASEGLNVFKSNNNTDSKLEDVSNPVNSSIQARDAVLCTLNKDVPNAVLLPMMSADDYGFWVPENKYKDNNYQNCVTSPIAVFLGAGRRGADCAKLPSEEFEFSWQKRMVPGSGKDYSRDALSFSALPDEMGRNKNYDICPGDSGAPLLAYNNRTNRFEMTGVLSRGISHSNKVEDLVTAPYQQWLASNGVKPWKENTNATYYNLTADSTVEIPLAFSPCQASSAVYNAPHLKKPTDVGIINNMTAMSSVDPTLYVDQAIHYMSLNRTIRSSAPLGKRTYRVYPEDAVFGNLTFATQTTQCHWQWNMTKLDALPYDTETAYKYDPIDKTVQCINVTVTQDSAAANLTAPLLAETDPPNLLLSNKGNCVEKKFTGDISKYTSSAPNTLSRLNLMTVVMSYLLRKFFTG